jgi:hypothetical protein
MKLLKAFVLVSILVSIGMFTQAQTIPSYFAGDTSLIKTRIETRGYQGGYQELVDSIFGRLSMSQVTSNTLVNRHPFQNYWKYNGVRVDSNLTSFFTYRNLYVGLWWSATTTNGQLPPFRTFDSTFSSVASPIQVSALTWNYQYLDSTSVDANLIRVENGQLVDVVNRPRSPYKTKTVYACGLNADTAIGPNQTFLFKRINFFTNSSVAVTSIRLIVTGEFDLPISFDSPVPVAFTSFGKKKLILRITLSNGQTKEMHTLLRLGDVVAQVQARSLNSSITSYFESNSPEQSFTAKADFAYSGSPAEVLVTYKLACGNNQLRKPLIFIDGFDPSQVTLFRRGPLTDYNSFKRTFDYYDYSKLIRNAEGTQLSSDLNGAGYDLVFIDYKNGSDFIQNNAYAVIKALQMINAMKVGNEKLIVIGASMGGLVGRIAIREMELRGLLHNVESYYTFDTPHQGANVPLSIQGFVNGMYSHMAEAFGIIEELNNLQDILYSPAATQMAISQYDRKRRRAVWKPATFWQAGRFVWEYYSESNQANYNIRQQFLGYIQQIGYPQQCRYVNIANGNVSGRSQSLGAQGNILKIVGGALGDAPCAWSIYAYLNAVKFIGDDHSYNFWSLAAGFAGGVFGLTSGWGSEIEIRLTSSPNSSHGESNTILFDLQLRYLFLVKITGLYFRYTTRDAWSTDNLPGGALPLASYLNFEGAENNFFCTTQASKEPISFIPTFSSLDVKTVPGAQWNPYDDLTNPTLRAKYIFPAITYFTDASGVTRTTGPSSQLIPAIHHYKGTLQQFNEEHVQISPNSTAIFRGELLSRFDNSLRGVTELRTRSYNFGAGYLGATPSTPGTTPTPTASRITNSINVGTGRYLGVHADDYVGFSDANPRLGYPDRTKQPGFEVLVTSLTDCNAGNSTVIDVESGGKIELGIFEDNVWGTLRLSRGTKLVLRSGSRLNIHNNSKLIIECGATLQIYPGATIYREDGTAKIIANNLANIIIMPGASFPLASVEPEAQLTGPGTVGGTVTGELFEVSNFGENNTFYWTASDPSVIIEDTDVPWRKRIRDNCSRTDASGTIRVTLSPFCGTAPVLSKTVSIINGTPMGPISTAITGPNPAYKFTRFCNDPECQSITTSENTSTYSIPAVANVNASNGYRWTVTNGTIISGADQNGVGTRTIGVQVDDVNVSTMTVSVYAVNPCGTTVTRSRTVSTRQWQDFTSCPGFRVCPNGGGGGARSARTASASTSSAATIASPNPASTSLNIETLLIGDPEMPLSYQLVNSRTGQIALSGTMTHWNFNLDVGSIPRGVYTLKLNNRLASDAIRISVFP